MSRSFKKTPGYCDRNPFMKKYANNRLKNIDVADGKAYRKVTNPWDIKDHAWLQHTKQEVIKEAEYMSETKRNKKKSHIYKLYMK